MSCYAFFKRWLPLSQLAKIFKIFKIPLTLNSYLRSLAYDLGCFPFDIGPSRSMSAYLYKFNPIISFTNVKGAYSASP